MIYGGVSVLKLCLMNADSPIFRFIVQSLKAPQYLKCLDVLSDLLYMDSGAYPRGQFACWSWTHR